MTEKKWLVKSSDTIQGPLEFDVVVENIFTGDIHLLDEIKGPFERWRPIKDHSLFAAAIEKLKATTYQQRENTVTEAIDLGTKTHEITHSKTLTLTQNKEETVTPTQEFPDEMPETTVVYTPGAPPLTGKAEETALPPIPEENPAVPPPSPQHVVMSQKQQNKRFPAVFLISFLVLVMGGALYLFNEFNQTRLIEQKISAYDQLTDIAIDSLKVGEYNKALKNFRMAFDISPQDPNLMVEMSPLSIQFDGQFDKTRADLENMLVVNRQNSIKQLAHNIIGLSYSYKEQYKEALKSYNKALEFDDQFLPALLNKSFVLLKLKKYEDAKILMDKVVRDNPDEAIAHYFLIRALTERGLANEDIGQLKEVLSVSDQFGQKFADFRQEVLFLITVVQAKIGVQPAELQGYMTRFMQVDIELTKLHVHDTLVDFQSFNWIDYFNKHCKVLEAGIDDYYKKMLNGFCLLKVNRPLESKKIFEELMSQNNDDGVLQALYASTLLKLNNLSQAKNALGFINQIEKKKPVVETIMRGCLKAGDLNCGEAIFRGRHAKHISLLYSHWGNSEVNFAKNRRKAKSSVVLGLEISPNFAPLLKIKRKF